MGCLAPSLYSSSPDDSRTTVTVSTLSPLRWGARRRFPSGQLPARDDESVRPRFVQRVLLLTGGTLYIIRFRKHNHLVGLVVRRPPRERKIPGLNPACAGIFSGSSHTSDLKIGTPVATLPGAWRYRVSTGTGRPGVSIL